MEACRDLRVWCIINPIGGGGKGLRVIKPVTEALVKRFGAANVLTMNTDAFIAPNQSESRPSGTSDSSATPSKQQRCAPVLNGAAGITDNVRAIILLTQKERDGCLAADGIVEYMSTTATADAENKLMHYVIAVGGDGTLSEVVNGLCIGTIRRFNNLREDALSETSSISEDVFISRNLPKLIYLPAGTGADFARLGYCCKNVKDVLAVLSIPPLPTMHHIDIGSAMFPTSGNRKFFINECSVGMSAEVVQKVISYKKTSFLRYLGGTIVFFSAAIVALVTMTPKLYRLMRLPDNFGSSKEELVGAYLDVKGSSAQRSTGATTQAAPFVESVVIREKTRAVGEWVEFGSSTVVFGNGKYFGGGMKVTPHGDPTDQMLAVTTWFATFVPFVFRLLSVYNGNHQKWKSTALLEGRRFLVDVGIGQPPQMCELDGEIGEHLPVLVDFAGHITMCTPAKTAAAPPRTSAGQPTTLTVTSVCQTSTGNDQPDEKEPLLKR